MGVLMDKVSVNRVVCHTYLFLRAIFLFRTFVMIVVVFSLFAVSRYKELYGAI